MSDGFLPVRIGPGNELAGDRGASLRAGQAHVGGWLIGVWHKCLLGIVVLEIPLLLDRYFLHEAADAEFGAISGFNISLTTVCLVLLVAQWLPRQIVELKRISVSKSLVAFFFISALTFFWAADGSRTLYGIFLLFQAVLIFVLIVNTTRTQREVYFVMKLLVIGFAIQSVMMVASKVLGKSIILGPVEFELLQDSGRVAGSFGSPNVASSYIALLFAPCLGLLFSQVPRGLKTLALLAICFASVGLVFTLSRGGWLATALSAGMFITIAFHKRWLSGKVFAAIVVGVLLVMTGFLGILSDRLLGDDGGSAASRVPLVEISTRMIAENPMGVGANNWDIVGRRHAESTELREEWFYTVHNKYMLVLSETGWLGFSAYLAFLGSILFCGWRAVQRPGNPMAPLALGLTVAFAGQILHMAFDIFNSRTQIQMLFLVASLIVAVSNISSQSEDRKKARADAIALETQRSPAS